MRDGLVLYDRDQQRREQDVGHLPVEEVHSVVGLRHHGGLVSAGDVVLHALVQKGCGTENTLSVTAAVKKSGVKEKQAELRLAAHVETPLLDCITHTWLFTDR